MSTRLALKNISIRCNRVAPRCDKCESIGAECAYLPRKTRAKKQGDDINENGVLLDILHRLKRLEEHCSLEKAPDINEHGDSSMSFSSVDSDISRPVSSDKSYAPAFSGVIGCILSHIKNPQNRVLLLSNVFSHLRTVESCFFENECCKSFLLSIPDLLENPHIQLDYTSQIIYHTVRLQGIILDPSSREDDGGLVRHLYQTCLTLTDCWLDHIQNTPADLFAAVSMALEGCNSELAWKMLGHACTIAKALGYFSVDGNPEEADGTQGSTTDETKIDKNRKRFEFWHLLRTDCLFRLSFGKPTLISAGSWKVNFPDPTINGVDDGSSRFIQIHFLASMRLALVTGLTWGADPDPVLHDATVDSFLAEVQLIMSDWDTDELLRMAKTQIDTWFCVDMIFSSYKFLIILHQSKKLNQERHRLPHQTVDTSRKSLQMFQSLLGSSLHAYWGISLILFHQLIPFFILCLDIIGNPERGNVDIDLPSVTWISDYVEKIVEKRAELRPVMIIMKVMMSACHQVKTNRMASTMKENP
ncbi:hypothetical protein N7526_000828 [Penicillium atrosanguineum]|nr:hypothetical protein N7526_000828 [Penicillium atrosanguineum]